MRQHVVSVMACAGLGLITTFFAAHRDAWAQWVPAGHRPARAFVVVTVVVSLVGLVLVATVAVGEVRRRRVAEAMHLKSVITGALQRRSAPIELHHLALNVHVPFWRGSPIVIDVVGWVAAPEHRDVALRIIRTEASQLRQNFAVEDRISIVPQAPSS